MAAVVQQTRTTRSTRVTATSTKLAQAPIQGHGQANGGEVSTSATSAASAASAAPASPAGGPSSLSLFLTNVKLLDLDLLPDWPNLSCDMFAASGTSVQGQKRRMHCVEWVLFQLFAIWDPQETANKLKPFFPPLDQLQSLNLRAALIRALEQAKKSGIFGRDTVIRKSMLDECRGDKFEEVLAYFSTAVLKKVISEDMAARGGHMFPVVDLVFENKGYKGEKMELLALALAHRVSLHRLLERKEEARARYRDLSELLDVKDRGIARRNEAVLAKELNGVGQIVSDNARAEMRRTLRNNWSGNETWMEALLRGDAKDGGLTNTPFDKVWRRVQQGRLGDLEADGAGLLQQLESRVRVQKERLEKWDAFRRDMFGESKASPSKPRTSTAKTRGIDLGFGVHLDLHLGRMSKPMAAIRSQGPQMNDDYADLVTDLKEELARITNKDVDLGSLLLQREPIREQRRIISTSSAEGARAEDDISDLEDAEDAFRSDMPITSFQDKLAGAHRPAIRPRLSRPNLSQASSHSSSGPRMATGQKNFPGKSQYDIDHFEPALPAPTSNQTKASTSGASMRRPLSDSRSVLPPELAPQMQPDISPTQNAADQILESMDNATPSPVKRTKPRHTLSLAERTHLSLTRKKSLLLFEDEEPDLPASNPVVPVAEKSERITASPEPMDDLVSRTQRSMAGFEKAQQKAQMERRRSQRRAKVPPRREGSYFPKVDEDVLEANRLAEQLADEEDMEAVFRSRPKIKASPNPSPIREWAIPE